ncbi:hypothetical protein TpMuguga_01g01115 [Theileria parva strain Muguga]|uniref:Uncharacterized protein n=1 Tax=Theileria parva TaxID=5875 RepID=Q4N6Q5_THEPA|nr:uncharacterized protein TpMuguga_01g01115 [Theileria parva strain Muguga]EAN34353.1 hypothetical protein TpMuguga_01g01115 [Theileria parva strain Muguga]|eukprot:XP_766636.1 hypothetical protein [Theileria parva strain Muguga]
MIPYFLFTFISFIILKYSFSSHNPTFYILDKDVSLNTNTLFNEFCIDKPRENVVCIVLKPDILNSLICYNKSCLMCVNSLQKNACYYGFFTPKCSGTILYPLIGTKSPISITSYSEYSLIQLGNNGTPDSCTALIDEICRINRDFAQSLELLIPGGKPNVLSLKFNSTRGVDKNYIIQEFDLPIPSRKKFFDYILTLITDNFYPHVNQYLKNLEDMLKFRECVLMNELDSVFYDTTQFPLMTYKKFDLFYLYIPLLTLFLE